MLKRALIFSFLLTILIVSSQAATVVLRWTAPGDDRYVGRAMVYDLRYSTAPITDANWSGATVVGGLSLPKPYGNREIVAVTGLVSSTKYYFAIKAADDKWNWSPLSNIAIESTCGGCTGKTGNVNGSPDGVVDIQDLAILIQFLSGATTVMPICYEQANVDASLDGLITVSDLSWLVAYMTAGKTLPYCQ